MENKVNNKRKKKQKKDTEKQEIHMKRLPKVSPKKLTFRKRRNKEQMNKIHREFIHGLENKVSVKELTKRLKISRPTAYRILNLEIARSIYQGFSVPQIAERLHKSSNSIMGRKHAFIINNFRRNGNIRLIPEMIGCSEDYVIEKLIVHKLKKKENIMKISKSLDISVEKTKTIIEDYAIRKIHDQGYTREELNRILPVSLDGYPRILEVFQKVEKNNKLVGDAKKSIKKTNTVLLRKKTKKRERLSFDDLVKKRKTVMKIGKIATELDRTPGMVKHRMAKFIIDHSIRGISRQEISNQLCLTQTEIKTFPYQYIKNNILKNQKIQGIAERNGCTLAQIYKIYVEGAIEKNVSINEIACTLKISEEAVQEIVNKIQNESQPELNTPEPPIIEKAISEVKKNLIQEGTIQPPKPISMAESTNQFHQIYTKTNRLDPLREIIVSEYKENQNIGVISYQYNLSPEEIKEIIYDYIRNEEKKERTVNEIAEEFSFYSVPNSDGKLRFIHKDEVLSLVKNNPLYQSTSHQPLQPISMDELTSRFDQIELRSNSSDQVKGKYEKSQEMKSEGERKRRNSESDPGALDLSLKKARVDSPILSQPKSFSSTTTRAVEKVQNVIEQKWQQHLNNPRVQASLRSFVNERSLDR
ncbi:hypothetical protein [Enterococcus hirae]|uniref:hypothetical protein n=1 Tax=Enterococcus hirae TaxID=1354 RepID=UPI0020038BFA|nr:hypothetical protein [Enterococcus hirae]MCK6145189.1 hypothetical protein [Enterococcus hirae]MCK6172908.1 hypothetical protein [Enterococcus hirae]